ncbi:transposase [Streptomyces sp. CAI-121]|uniref:integrase core domain-containing protein n=1 Tax=unclassified Streptomyces TaxID=2593676 RepID=UPI0015879F3B|nr:transposase [Streptomyces sp. CAI-121]NUW18560.1 transposase [Streptomyces sp. CAI-68]
MLQRPVESGQYTTLRIAGHLDAAGIGTSIGSVGDAYDNALMESTIGLFKAELIKPGRPLRTLSQVELATAKWIDWYCHRRLHGEIGHIPPAEYETNYYCSTPKPQVTTTIWCSHRTRNGSARTSHRKMAFGPYLGRLHGTDSLKVRNVSSCPFRS